MCICGFMEHGISLSIHLTFLSESIFFGVCQELNLSFGEITEEAALTVANAVKNKSNLKKLDLNGTNLLTLLRTSIYSYCIFIIGIFLFTTCTLIFI